jgi:TonB-linked SusC/RagA family outer membrane protein
MITQRKRKKSHAKKIFSMLLVGFLLGYTGNMTVRADNRSNGYSSEYQQTDKKITGKVVDSNHEPLVGVSVQVRGTQTGTITNVDGQYSISVKSDNQVLQFSYLGYKTVTATTNKSVIDVTMVEDAQALNEVVVVGYGTQKKANLTGAVNSVDVEKTLSNRPISDVGRSLQGTVPGLSISVPNGEVGSDPVIRIRGQIASINSTASSQPLILLDNVEISSLTLINPDDVESISVLKDAAASSIYGAKASLGVILVTTKKGAKTDKATVSYSNNFAWSKVAKDIDMATIDGLEYSLLAVERTGTNRTGVFFFLDRNSYNRSREWYDKYSGTIGANDPYVYGRDWYMDGNSKMGVRTFNAYDYMVAEWTPTMTHNLSVNGKSGKTTYNIGLGYFDQTGLMKTAKKDDFKRYNATAKLSTEISKYVTMRTGFLFSQRTKSYPYITNSTTADPWLYVYRWGPLQPFGYDENGNVLRSPASEAAQANTATQQYNYMNYNLGTTVNFTKAWSLEADYTFTNNQLLWNRPGTRYTAADTWSAPVAKLDENGNQIYVNTNGEVVSASSPGAMPAWQLPLNTYTGKGSNPDHIRRESENTQMNTFNVYSTYQLKLPAEHDFKFMLGTNIVYSKRQNHWSQKTELLDINDPQFNKASGTQTSSGESFWESQAGFFGRINYVFNNKYLAEANLRYDGTSKFPAGLKWRWFPSFSAGWIASEEAFMEDLKPVLSFWKFRGSWGIIGDQTVANNLYVPILPNTTSSWLDGTTKFPYFGTPLAVEPSITWQDFETLDFGVDARFFNGKLGISYDWYQRYTRNMISAGVTLPYTAGVPSPQGNFSELRTRGWELSLDFNHRFNNGIGINLTASLSDATSYITGYDASAAKGTAATSYWKGKRLGDIWGYQVEGLYQKSDFELDSNGKFITVQVLQDPNNPNSSKVGMNKLKGDNPVYQPFLQTPSNFTFGPGDVKYKDQNGDQRISNGSNTANDPGDLVVIGNSLPRYQYGFRVGADYKGVDFSIFFQGIGKRSLWGDGALAIPGYNVSDGAMPQAIAGNFWREAVIDANGKVTTAERLDAFYPRPYNVGSVAYGSTVAGNTYPSDRYLLNMAYLRVKNVTLGYSLPLTLLKKAYISKARIYASMENILTWDNLRGLPIDPEVVNGYSMWNTTDYNSNRTGIGAPMFKNVSVGLQLNF